MSDKNKPQKQTTKISKILRKIRIDLDITRIQMAKDCGVSEKVLIAVESGALLPTLALLKAIESLYVEHGLMEKLKSASAEAVKTLTLDMSTFTEDEKISVLEIKFANEERQEKLKQQEAVEKAEADAEKKRLRLLAKKEAQLESSANLNELAEYVAA